MAEVGRDFGLENLDDVQEEVEVEGEKKMLRPRSKAAWVTLKKALLCFH